LNIEIFDKPQESKPDPVRLRLLPGTGGRQVLYAVDRLGNPRFNGALLTIHPDGAVERHALVSPELGFPLDEYGRVREASRFALPKPKSNFMEQAARVSSIVSMLEDDPDPDCCCEDCNGDYDYEDDD
jgi:hypothetical protein